ncbi:SDR family oxidoreductase [Streptomyces sp. Go-475]|uniref:SDR family oxidoreductase n=1 Tax=Streptomyces sp. Go-475 TaxID=2072505 RepID=UPI0022B7FD91|nr:SDR family oxidoreductase [Streptomyces sp. Go-475]
MGGRCPRGRGKGGESERGKACEADVGRCPGASVSGREIATMVVCLASDHASATTGGALRVDGGYVDSILP